MNRDLYEILEVSPNASVETIKSAYYTLLKKYTHDMDLTNGSDEKIKELNYAYGVLSDIGKRNIYDLGRKGNVAASTNYSHTDGSHIRNNKVVYDKILSKVREGIRRIIAFGLVFVIGIGLRGIADYRAELAAREGAARWEAYQNNLLIGEKAYDDGKLLFSISSKADIDAIDAIACKDIAFFDISMAVPVNFVGSNVDDDSVIWWEDNGNLVKLLRWEAPDSFTNSTLGEYRSEWADNLESIIRDKLARNIKESGSRIKWTRGKFEKINEEVSCSVAGKLTDAYGNLWSIHTCTFQYCGKMYSLIYQTPGDDDIKSVISSYYWVMKSRQTIRFN